MKSGKALFKYASSCTALPGVPPSYGPSLELHGAALKDALQVVVSAYIVALVPRLAQGRPRLFVTRLSAFFKLYVAQIAAECFRRYLGWRRRRGRDGLTRQRYDDERRNNGQQLWTERGVLTSCEHKLTGM